MLSVNVVVVAAAGLDIESAHYHQLVKPMMVIPSSMLMGIMIMMMMMMMIILYQI